MPLDPEFRAILDGIEALPRIHATPIAELRARRGTLWSPVELAHAEDRQVPREGRPIPVRLYRPGPGRLPLVVFFHGGGFVYGSLDGYYDPLCRRIARDAACAVVAVDYRLAPEHKFPAGADDCYAALAWAAEALDIDASRILVAGPSAGGNLAAATALRARDAGGPDLAGQVLIYPVLDYYEPPTPSYLEYADGYHLTRADMVWFWDHYLAEPNQADDPRAAPLRASNLAGLPPAFIVAAECDPLHDEAARYAQRLRDAGVATELLDGAGLIHGFLAYPTAGTEEVVRRTIDWIRARF